MVKNILLGFGGILLEDIGLFYCFEIEECLKEEFDILVMYDDQYGIVVVMLVVVILVCCSIGVNLKEVKVGQIGLGVVGIVICRMFMVYGVKQVIGVDKFFEVNECLVSYGGKVVDLLEEFMENCDIVIVIMGVFGLI